LDAVTFALAVWLVWSISMPHRKSALRCKVSPEIIEGWTWMRAHPAIPRLAVMLGLIHAASMMPMTILVPCSQDILDLSAIFCGTLLRAGAAGGVIGSLLGPRFVARIGAQSSVFLAPTMMAVPFVIIALTSNPYVMGFALLSEMITAQLWNVVTVSYCQRLSPDDLLGRVDFLYRFFGWGLLAVAALAGAGSSQLSHAL
jgi:predicted MFS family arabinose efflux permease